MTQKKIAEVLNVTVGFVRKYDINYRTLVETIKRREKGYITDRDVKNKLYGMRATEKCKDTIWRAYVQKYMSHVVLNYVPIKDKYTNPYVDYRGMEI